MDLEANFGRAYFEQRRDRNRQLAARSATPALRNMHLEYARLYEQLLQAEDAQAVQPSIWQRRPEAAPRPTSSCPAPDIWSPAPGYRPA
ncbi:hypothetical protein BV87_11925 [Sphingobium yanoikuyae]|uniref:Uncharacterized protein n=1 Tax=Sphingobium yanoikuyae TaxID=13690 RepID=A0A2D1R2I4_SPHYA|nr:hypothetical protein BV87_11925 [Sphingobium yanoikuyae]